MFHLSEKHGCFQISTWQCSLANHSVLLVLYSVIKQKDQFFFVTKEFLKYSLSVDMTTKKYVIREHIVFYGIFISATDNIVNSCTVSLTAYWCFLPYTWKLFIFQSLASSPKLNYNGKWPSDWLFRPRWKAVNCNTHPGIVAGGSWESLSPVFWSSL